MSWQPIETAPKGGVVIIAFRPTDPPHIEAMYWVQYSDGTGAWHYAYDGDCSYETPPTHWIPLPEPPK